MLFGRERYVQRQAKIVEQGSGTSVTPTSTSDTTPPSAIINLSSTNVNIGNSLTATVTHTDSESGINITSCRYVFNTISSAIGTNASSYTGGAFSSSTQTLTLNTGTAGTYYLHVLSVDNEGNEKETISLAVTITTVTPPVALDPAIVSITDVSFDEPSWSGQLFDWEMKLEFSNPTDQVINVIRADGVGTDWMFGVIEPNSTKVVNCSGTVRFMSGETLKYVTITIRCGSIEYKYLLTFEKVGSSVTFRGFELI